MHRLLGIVLLLPMLGWAGTGLVFFVKPGYDAAYGELKVRDVPPAGTRPAAPERGPLVDALYRAHYLQWTGYRFLDRVLGVAGLAALVTLTALGARLAFGRPR